MDDRAVTTPNGTAHATLPSRRSTSISQLGNFYISYLEAEKPSADINRFSSADHWIIESNFKCVHISDQWGANLKLQNGIIEPTICAVCWFDFSPLCIFQSEIREWHYRTDHVRI